MIKDMYQEFRNLLRQVTPMQAMARELLQAEMELLRAETGVEYAQAVVTYNKQRVKRLKAYLAPVEEKAQ